MPQRHEHVDLDVLQQVEELLTQIEPGGAPAADEGPAGFATVHALVPVPTPDPDGTDPGATHPSAHVPRGATVAEAPVTPLPRRR